MSDCSRLYGTSTRFSKSGVGFLRAKPPFVLSLDEVRPLGDFVGQVSGPSALGLPARPRRLGLFNPSIAPAPTGLCPRCAFVASVRVDALHQCDDLSPYVRRVQGRLAANAWFKGTALAVLDDELGLLSWTWLMSSPRLQVTRSPKQAQQGYHVEPGAAGNFSPPWSLRSYDTRLLNFDGRHLFATALEPCEHSPMHRCSELGLAEFAVQLLQLTAEPTASGGVAALRAWLTHRASSSVGWMQGRNQALFRGGGDGAELMVSPWLGLVATLGAPAFGNRSVRCHPSSRGGVGHMSVPRRRTNLAECAHAPRDTLVRMETASGLGAAALTHNDSAAHALGARGPPRLSATANLVEVWRGGKGKCRALLGVAHTHRGDGPGSSKWRGGGNRPAQRPSSAERQPFHFGFRYTHFFYTLSPTPPHELLATSAEFCISAPHAPHDCESVQFVSGLAVQPRRGGSRGAAGDSGGRLMLSFGVNDCQARLGFLALKELWKLLEPVPGASAACKRTS